MTEFANKKDTRGNKGWNLDTHWDSELAAAIFAKVRPNRTPRKEIDYRLGTDDLAP